MQLIRVKSIKKIESGKVRNLTVHKNHTFLAENGIVTHNCDGASDQFHKALRATIEAYAETARFILTCNYINKIPDALQSRCTVIDFTPQDKEEEEYIFNKQVTAVAKILSKLKIESSNETTQLLVKKSFPDMRKLFNRIQTLQISGVTELDSNAISKTDWSFENIYELCISKSDPYKNYCELVGEYSAYVDDVLHTLGSEFPKWIAEKHSKFIPVIPQIVVEVAHHQAQKTQVIDTTISMLSCIFKIQNLTNSIK